MQLYLDGNRGRPHVRHDRAGRITIVLRPPFALCTAPQHHALIPRKKKIDDIVFAHAIK